MNPNNAIGKKRTNEGLFEQLKNTNGQKMGHIKWCENVAPKWNFTGHKHFSDIEICSSNDRMLKILLPIIPINIYWKNEIRPASFGAQIENLKIRIFWMILKVIYVTI